MFCALIVAAGRSRGWVARASGGMRWRASFSIHPSSVDLSIFHRLAHAHGSTYSVPIIIVNAGGGARARVTRARRALVFCFARFDGRGIGARSSTARLRALALILAHAAALYYGVITRSVMLFVTRAHL